jgi:hypothetical protein
MLTMGNSLWKQLIVVCLLAVGSGILWSCSFEEKVPLKAEVELAHRSVYVWNKGDRAWRGGMVFLDERSQEVSTSFGTVKPGGFAQLPLSEFRRASRPVPEYLLQPKVVWVEVEGYTPEKLKLSRGESGNVEW